MSPLVLRLIARHQELAVRFIEGRATPAEEAELAAIWEAMRREDPSMLCSIESRRVLEVERELQAGADAEAMRLAVSREA